MVTRSRIALLAGGSIESIASNPVDKSQQDSFRCGSDIKIQLGNKFLTTCERPQISQSP